VHQPDYQREAIICLLRGVNLGRRQIKMDVLRALCESLGLGNPQSYLQSGNLVFTSDDGSFAALRKRLEAAIEAKFGFHSDVVLRSGAELRDVIARNPFRGRKDVPPNKLIVNFLAEAPSEEVRNAVLNLKGHKEEVHMDGREIYVYFPDGMGRSKLVPVLTRTLKNSGTARNWNTVTKLLEMAEKR
jgi:uncharacterized protein (DUF1697 family)